MRETPLSNCERDFILKNISEHRRLDGRSAYDYRDLRVSFGITSGCCHVELGKTRVLAQVSCQVGQPKPTRPHDGVLFVNVELSPMASPSFEHGRLTEEGVELSRLMERCLKESRCVDLESLCIVAGEKAWEVRVDVHILNHDGNILDCSSIAAIGALTHFRRPDVTVLGEEITVHSMEERDPVPLSIHHIPVLVSFTFFSQGKFMLVDPSEKEEKVMDGKMVIGMNKHREICTLQVTGQMFLLKDQVLRCSNIAVSKVTRITELLLEALENDKQARARGEKHGFAELVSQDKITSNQLVETAVEVNMEQEEEEGQSRLMDSDSEEEGSATPGKDVPSSFSSNENPVEILEKGVGIIGEGGASTWLDLPAPTTKSGQSKSRKRAHKASAPVGDTMEGESSEEESQMVLENLS